MRTAHHIDKDKVLSLLAAAFIFLSIICALLADHFNAKVMGEASLGVGVWAPSKESAQWIQKVELRRIADNLFHLGILFAIFGLVTEALGTLLGNRWPSTTSDSSDSGHAQRNKRRRFVLATCYFLAGLSCLFGSWNPERLPSLGLEIGVLRRLLWCFGWSSVGFSVVGFSSIKSESVGKNPFPSYFYFYPAFLCVNSLLVFGVLHLFDRTSAHLFYPFAAWACMNLGFWVDTIRFDRLIDSALRRLGQQ